VEPVVTEPRDELAAVPDVIDTDGGDDFSAFATSRWPGLVRLAFGLTGDRWLAEDVAQTALARAYVAWRRVSQADDPDAYLRRILVNASNRRFRRRRVAEQPGDPPEIPVDGPAELVGERAAVLAAQIAATLGCSPGTVRSQLSRALGKLRAALAEDDAG
jgi:DNA-directed RNA polymerase specialized sigma24 family protein